MSDDFKDIDMEVVEGDELDEMSRDGEPSRDEHPRLDTKRKEGKTSRTLVSESGESSNREIFDLGSLPEEWQLSSLPSVVGIEMGSSPPSSTYNEEKEGLPFYQGNADFGYMTPKVSTWCSDPVKTADKDDVLISIRAPVGDLNIADEHCCIGRGLAALRPDEVNGLYLFYALAQRSRWLSRLASGSTFKSVSSADLEKVDLPIPPILEQRKIASVLYAVDQAIQKTEAVIEQSERVKRGLMQDFMRSGFHEHDLEKTETRFGPLPRSWEVKRLKELGRIAGRTAPEKEDSECWGGDIPWATPSEITNLEGNTISKTEEYLTERALEKVSSNLLPPWSVLLTTRATVGACAVNTVPMTTNQGFKSVIPGEDLNTWYAYYRLVYEADQLEARAKGSTFREVGKETVENFEIPVPPREEQQRIGEILKSIDDQILKDKETVSEYERLKKGLMQDLLTGEVRTADKAIEVLDEVKAHG
jgi:type I restriction enzyme S subunit